MKKKLLTLLAAVWLLSPLPALAQIGQTAVLTGTVTDASGGALAGATVTAASDALIGGTRTTQTDTNGVYRFPALAPGTYNVSFELSGFRAIRREARLQLGQTITVDATLEVGGVTDAVEVRGSSPTIEISSSGAQKHLSKEILEYVPYSTRFGPDAIILAPGVNPNTTSAFGSGGESSNAWMIDGVDVSDPRGGSQWLFSNYNWFQEVQFAGLGAPAEFGGFTGLASNSLIRSGSNRFSGLFETLFQNKDMTSDNISEEVLADNPDLTADKLDYTTDTTVQIGGPFQRDKLWFFTSFQYYRPKSSPNGYPPPGTDVGLGPSERKETSPRFIFKPTLRLGQADQLTGFIEWDEYVVEAAQADANTAPEATFKQTGPEVAWNANYSKVLSSRSLFDVRYAGFDGYYAREPYRGREIMGWYDDDTGFYSVNGYYYLRNDRSRHQVNTSLTRFASGFAGEHNLKFGAEFERSHARNEVGYPGGGFVVTFGGEPYAYLGGNYLLDGKNTRLSMFAQDSWRVGRRLTLEPGLRLDIHRGTLFGFDDAVLKTTAWGPRIGAAFDLTGNSRTVVRAHYGRYYDGAKVQYFTLLADRDPRFGAYIDPVTLQPLDEPELISAGTSQTTINDSLKHPHMDQAIVGFEHELFRDFAVGANFIYRRNGNFIDDILTNGQFAASQRVDRGPDNILGTADDGTLTVYNQLNPQSQDEFFITNPDALFRRYRGVELTANKRLSNRWMVQGSWVISKIVGNITNSTQLGNSIELDSPNFDPALQPFREGRLSGDNTHIAKVLWAYVGPWGINLSGAYFYTSGSTYTRVTRFSLNQGNTDLFAEPRGSRRLDAQPKFDLKAEKRFRLANGQLGLSFEAFNLFNNGAVNDRFTRTGNSFERPDGVVAPRQLRVGAAFRF